MFAYIIYFEYFCAVNQKSQTNLVFYGTSDY